MWRAMVMHPGIVAVDSLEEVLDALVRKILGNVPMRKRDSRPSGKSPNRPGKGAIPCRF